MSAKRIFLTGMTGFFGKSLLQHCLELRQHELVILAHESEDVFTAVPGVTANPRIRIIRGDIRNFQFPAPEFDYIFHGATTSGRIIPDDEMRSVVMDGTGHILDFARQNRGLSKFLYISSGAVYGNQYTIPVKEDFPCKPATVYGRSKLEAEKLCLDSGLPCAIARGFAFVGEHLPLDAHFAIGNFIRDCLNNSPIVIQGDGSPLRAYLYAGDLAHWLWTILLYGESGCAYNVGSDCTISIRELAETVRDVAGTDNEIRILSPPSNNTPQCYAPDISRTRSRLGLEVKIPLKDALRKTIEHHRRRNAGLDKKNTNG